ncbi:MAG: hypothetical protein ACI9U0_000939 [Flavobacteriales bacterium]|jgi:hypothetical protein|tara:strand:+ start:4003 stop:4143 length:141 start_codon:yes stop_codon:yes gene_type:complete
MKTAAFILLATIFTTITLNSCKTPLLDKYVDPLYLEDKGGEDKKKK